MIDVVRIPFQEPSGTDPENIRFFKNIGDRVNPGELLFSYEYDGALFEENAVTEGQVLAIFLTDGDSAPCGTPAIAISVSRDYL